MRYKKPTPARRGAPLKPDRENLTIDNQACAAIRIFPDDRTIFDRLKVNAPKRVGIAIFFRAVILFCYENQEKFYNYFAKCVK